MIWAIRKGEKVEAQKGLNGWCPLCGEKLIPKCGEIKIWHWSHKSYAECDSWYEPETLWHIQWKNNFPKEQQEVIIEKENKKHIADVKTRTGTIIEFQNSPIAPKEIEKREKFYENMIWVLNGNTLGKNIEFKRRICLWKWSPSIVFLSKKPIFIDMYFAIIKLKNIWRFRKKLYFSYIEYSKKDFLNLYGDVYDI